MLTLDLVEIDTTGWRPHERTPTDRSWFVGPDPFRFRLFDGPCLENTVDGWRQRAARETAAQGGTWLAFDEIDIAGCVAFQGIFKFPAARVIPQLPDRALAVFIVELIAVPLGDVHLMLNTDALEHGQTGTREALYLLMQPAPTGESTLGNMDMDAVFDRVRARARAEMNGAELRAQVTLARELLRPSPVRLGHRPAWLMRYLRPLRDRDGNDGGGSTDAQNPFPSEPAGGEFAWVVSTGGASGPVVAIDRDGNIAVAATQSGEVTLGTLHLAAPTGKALLVLKLTSDGKPVWGRAFPVAGSITANAITMTSEGGVAIGGQFNGGPLQIGDRQMTAAGNGDGFVVALDGASGAPLWSAQLGSSQDQQYLTDHVAALVAGPDPDGAEGIYAYGWLAGDSFSWGTSYLIRYNRDGTQRWAKSFDMDALDFHSNDSHTLALDPQRGPVITGEVTGQLVIDGQAVNGPIVVAGFDFDGQARFARSIRSEFQRIPGKVGVAPGGDVYFAGAFQGTPVVVDTGSIFVIRTDLDTVNSAFDLFQLRFTPSGSVAFSRMIRSPSSASSIAMVTDAAGASYLVGTCSGEVDVQPEIQCDPKVGDGQFVVSYDAGNTYRWATYAQPVRADLAAAPGGRLIMAGDAFAAEVNFGGVRLATQPLFIAAIAAGPARVPSPLPVTPTISGVTLDGAPDTEIRQGGTGVLVITGTALDQVTTAQLGDIDIHVPARAATATALLLPVTIPHGHATGPLTLTLSNAGGSAQQSVAVAVTPIVVGPSGSNSGRGTSSSPLSLRTASELAVFGDVLLLLDGIHDGDSGISLHTGVTIRGQRQAGTIIRGTKISMNPTFKSEPFPFPAVTIENLTIEDAGITSRLGKLIAAGLTLRGGGIAASGEMVATDIDITGPGGIAVLGTASVNHFRYSGDGTALNILSGQLVARDVVVDHSWEGVVIDTGSVDLADSDLSSTAQAIDAGSETTSPGTRTVSIANTKLRSNLRFVITEVTTQLSLTDCTLGPEDGGEVQDGIWMFGGSLALTRSALSGIQSHGIVLLDIPNVSRDLQVPSLTLDHVDIDAGDVGIADWTSLDRGQLRMRNSHIYGNQKGLSRFGSFATVDLGTADSPGGNQIESGPGGVALEDWDDGGVINAHGTTLNGTSLDGQVQGPASAEGRYTLHGTDVIQF